MLIVKPDSLPPLWWLFPWSICRQLHRNCNALKAYADRLEDILDIQRGIIEQQDDAIIKGTAITADARPYQE
jgi:hypothetical protein